ncbi:DUF805 domain-containing protein [Deltaproteobacteria bacterium TL4]
MIAMIIGVFSKGALVVLLLVVALLFMTLDRKFKEKGASTPSKSGHQYNDTSFFHPRYLSYLYFSWQGRISLKSLWAGMLFVIVLLIGILKLGESYRAEDLFLAFAFIIWYFAFTILGIKRLHDLDFPTHFILLLLFPLTDVWLILSSLLRSGTEGENRFGPDPISGSKVEEL